MPENIDGQKALVIRSSSMGDIVLTTPVVRVLAAARVEVHFLTKKQHASVLIGNPNIEKIHAFDSSLKEISTDLKAENFDFVVDLHSNLRSVSLCNFLRKKTLRYSKQRVKRWWLINASFMDLELRHITERYLEPTASLGLQYDGLGLDYYNIDQSTKVQGIQEQLGNYIVLNLGAKHYTKRMTAEIALAFVKKYNEKAVLIGGKDVEELAAEVETSSNALNLVGKLSLAESAAMVSGGELIITGDSGMMHIAAALDKDLEVVWGGTAPSLGFTPLYRDNSEANAIFHRNTSINCSPCSKHGLPSCPKKHFKCMKELKI